MLISLNGFEENLFMLRSCFTVHKACDSCAAGAGCIEIKKIPPPPPPGPRGGGVFRGVLGQKNLKK